MNRDDRRARLREDDDELKFGQQKFEKIINIIRISSLPAQMVKSPPAMQETWVPSLSWEDPLDKRLATHSSTLAWRIHWTEEPGGL